MFIMILEEFVKYMLSQKKLSEVEREKAGVYAQRQRTLLLFRHGVVNAMGATTS
jgi:hypothetical protein